MERGETAHSLNLKCYDAAIAGFSELIEAIAIGNLSPTPQPLRLRSYVRRTKRRLYRVERYPNKVHLFQSTEENIGRFLGIDHGWTDAVDNGLETHDVPGTHHGMLYEPNVRALAAAIGALIDDGYRQRVGSTLPQDDCVHAGA